MDREQQKKNAETLFAQVSGVLDAFQSLAADTHQWSSEKVQAAVDPEGMDEVADATTQFDITQTLTDIAEQALTQISTQQQREFEKNTKDVLMPEVKKPSRRRKGPASPVAAFAQPATQEREDYEEFRKVAARFLGPDAAPFPDDEFPKNPNRDRRGERVAPPLQGNDFAKLNDAIEIGAAVDEFSREMSQFSVAVVMAIVDLNRRLNSLTRSLESEGYDHR